MVLAGELVKDMQGSQTHAKYILLKLMEEVGVHQHTSIMPFTFCKKNNDRNVSL